MTARFWTITDAHTGTERDEHRAWLEEVHPTGPYTRGAAIDGEGRVWLLQCVNADGFDPEARDPDAIQFLTLDGENVSVTGPRPWFASVDRDGKITAGADGKGEHRELLILTEWVQLPEGTPLPPFAREEVSA